MGNCCGSESQEVESHQIGHIKRAKPKIKSGAGQTLRGGKEASTSPSNIDNEGSREAMLSAAEKRRLEAENRGVKDGGKLSKQLADEKKQKNKPLPANDAGNSLVWD